MEPYMLTYVAQYRPGGMKLSAQPNVLLDRKHPIAIPRRKTSGRRLSERYGRTTVSWWFFGDKQGLPLRKKVTGVGGTPWCGGFAINRVRSPTAKGFETWEFFRDSFLFVDRGGLLSLFGLGSP